MYRSMQPQTTTTPPTSATPNNTPGGASRKKTITIVEYGDYQCPPCGNLHPEMKKLKNEFGDRIRLVFYQFPLSQIHRNARDAAHAAMAAKMQGKFWEMHDMLYENQKQWSDVPDLHPIAVSYANKLNLDVSRFQHDMDGAEVDAAVAAELQQGLLLGVKGTPTLFIDGRLVGDDDMATDKLRQAINQQLNGY